LSADLRAVLALPDVQEKILGMGAEPSGNTPQEFSAFVKHEIDRWGKVIRDNNIRAD
jgi:tripartite-type tricarboxylate transporter receptor subunit TctC